MQVRPLPGVTRHQFTAVDVVSRCGVVGVRGSATAGTAVAFLADLVARFPFPVRTLQVDGGSEWMVGFETACQEREIALWVLPPRKPKWNGCVERLNRTSREEFWECYGDDLDLPVVQGALAAWEGEYNSVRPHQSLGMRTPAAFLAIICPQRPEPTGLMRVRGAGGRAEGGWLRDGCYGSVSGRQWYATPHGVTR